MSGKATQGSDYTMSASQITIQAGQTSGSVTLNAIVDNQKEKAEKATMTLQPGSGYKLGAGKGGKKKGKGPTATVTITD
jgi:FlaG/FlaF family flagellin (archaellin)